MTSQEIQQCKEGYEPAAMEAYHRELNAQAWRERWKRIGAWLGFVTVCAVCWYAIIWLAYKATEGR